LRFLSIAIILAETEQIQNLLKTTQLCLTKASNTKQTDVYLMQSGMSVACLMKYWQIQNEMRLEAEMLCLFV